MGLDFNVNDGMKKRGTRRLIWFSVLAIFLITLILIFNNKHNKFYGLETNIPDTIRMTKDTALGLKTIINDHSTNIKENNGVISIKQ